MNSDKIVSIIVIGFVIGTVSIALAGAEYFEELANTDAKYAASILIAGHNVGNYKFIIDPFRIHNHFIGGMVKKYDIAVFGNSRALFVYNENFPNLESVNHAVPGVNLGSIKKLINMYISHNNYPETIIMTTDPWNILYKETEKEVSLQQFTDHFTKLQNIPKIFRLDNLQALFGISAYNTYYATDEREGNRLILRIDGRFDPPPLQDDQEYVDALAQEGELIPSLKITPEYTLTFENYIQTLQERDITLIFLCAPFHPLRYMRHLNAEEKNPEISSLADMEAYIRNFADENDILVIGSYDPHMYNLTGKDFYDGIHPKPQAIAKIISAHSHDLYDLLYTNVYSTYEEYATALVESQAELFTSASQHLS